MLSINTNLPSLIAQNSLKNSTLKLNTAIERMTTGFKINSAKDNAANYSIVTNMSTKINAYQVAEDNVAMGLNLLDTANGGLDLISDKLTRLRALQEQALNGTYGEQSLKAINAEACAIVDEIERLYNTTEYNGNNLYYGNQAPPNNSENTEVKTITEVADIQYITEGTYSVNSIEEFNMLASMLSTGALKNATLILESDLSVTTGKFSYLDFSSANCVFDGNGHTISISGDRALFSTVGEGSEVKDLKVNANLSSGSAGLANYVEGKVIGCSVEGQITSGASTGGLVGNLTSTGEILNSSSSVNIKNTVSGGSYTSTGGLVGTNQGGTISGCFATGKVESNASDIGGLVGSSYGGTITECYSTATINQPSSSHRSNTVGYNDGNSKITNVYDHKADIKQAVIDTPAKPWEQGEQPVVNISFQVGINGSASSQIELNIGFGLGNFGVLKNIGLNNSNYLSAIDSMLSVVTAKQTEYGAAQNRLESALDEISTQYENLVSSRSTLRDADISEVSSEYIKQQILQQASATLLATANQSPALALQLI